MTSIFNYAAQPYTQVVVDFLNGIGLPTRVVPGSSAFLEHVRIVNGELEIDIECSPSNLLHEAGHLAVFPQKYRHLMKDDIDDAVRLMFEAMSKEDLDPDGQEYRAAMQASESEATAWAWAAGVHLGIPEHLIILDEEYEGDGENIRGMLSASAHFGVNGLMHAGFCQIKPLPNRNLPIYPLLAFWLQK